MYIIITYYFCLGTPIGLNRFKTDTLEDLLEWEFISKSEYSSKRLNPKHKITSSMNEGLEDVTREVCTYMLHQIDEHMRFN